MLPLDMSVKQTSLFLLLNIDVWSSSDIFSVRLDSNPVSSLRVYGMCSMLYRL